MKTLGLLLLPAGWIVVMACFVMLPSFALRVAFCVAGMAVEVAGLGLTARAYSRSQRSQKSTG